MACARRPATWLEADAAQASQVEGGAEKRSRTADLLITNQLLYQLSYPGGRRWVSRAAGRGNGSCEATVNPRPNG